jgi:septal ring factor EnvC (AmiA/AmiB activator)
VARYFLRTALTVESDHSSPVQANLSPHEEVTPHLNEAPPPREPTFDPRLLAAHSTIAALRSLRDTQDLAFKYLRTSLSESKDTVLQLQAQLEAANTSLTVERKRTQRLTSALSHINSQHSRPTKPFFEFLNPEILRHVHSSPVVGYRDVV